LALRTDQEIKNLKPWEVLQIEENASNKDIRRQARNLGAPLHPDKPENKDNEEAKKKISNYTIISGNNA